MKDWTGYKWAKMTVVKRVPSPDIKHPNSKCWWECLCECENKKIAHSKKIKIGSPKSCGCWQGNDPILTHSNHLYARYKCTAKLHKRTFNITKELFTKLIFSNCHYCGIAPSQTGKLTDNPYLIFYNGIDRIDSLKGYEKDNVVTCCKICNTMKSNLNITDFYKHIKSIVRHANLFTDERKHTICAEVTISKSL